MSDYENDSDDSDSKSDYEDNDQSIDLKQSFVLIAIDTHETMFIKDEEGFTPFSIAMGACYDLADFLLLEQNRKKYCQFAVVLADDDKKAMLLDFRDNILDSIKILKAKKDLSVENSKKLHMRKGDFDLASFFLYCKKRFTAINSDSYHRKILYITNDDNPVNGEPRKRFTAINEAKNFITNDITLELLTMNHDFKYNLFYNELFSVLNLPFVDEVAEDQDGLFDKLLSMIVARYSTRKLNFYPIKGDTSRYIPVVKKDLIKSQKLLNNAQVDRNTSQIVKKIVKETGTPNTFTLENHDKIVFDLEERNEVIESDLPIGLTLLYVSKRVSDVGIVLKKSSLVEFNEKSTSNALECKNLFNQFWSYCYKNNRVLVCARKMKLLDKIRFVELIPKFAFKRMLFMMKYIPDANEICNLPPAEMGCDKYNEEQAKVVEELIDKLTFDYDPAMLPDPCYARKRAYIKSKLLNEPMDDVEDASLNTSVMDETIGDVAKQFKYLFGLNEDAQSKKRKGPAGGSRAKKGK